MFLIIKYYFSVVSSCATPTHSLENNPVQRKIWKSFQIFQISLEKSGNLRKSPEMSGNHQESPEIPGKVRKS